RRHACHPPAAEQTVEERVESFRTGQLIEVTDHQAVLAIEVGAPVIRIQNILVAIDASARCRSILPAVTVGMGESVGGQKLQPMAEPFRETYFQPVVPRVRD